DSPPQRRCALCTSFLLRSTIRDSGGQLAIRLSAQPLGSESEIVSKNGRSRGGAFFSRGRRPWSAARLAAVDRVIPDNAGSREEAQANQARWAGGRCSLEAAPKVPDGASRAHDLSCHGDA